MRISASMVRSVALVKEANASQTKYAPVRARMISCVSADQLYPNLFFCQSVCPEKQPLENVACDIDDRYRCVYGNAVICNDNSIFNTSTTSNVRVRLALYIVPHAFLP